MRFGDRLRQERRRRLLSQEALAEALGCDPKSIRRWEHHQAFPQIASQLQISRFFGLHPSELFAELDESASPAFLWHVPYPRNPFFTGREEILQYLHEQLNRLSALTLTQSLAVSGLGGIGKTQIALEYAYHYRQDYPFVFWTNAATRETLLADLALIADLLHLPERPEQDQHKVLLALKRWFATHQDWLWILDNADDKALLWNVLPTERPGHLLITSRAHTLGSFAQQVEVEAMGMAEGTLFLLRRARLLAPDAPLETVSHEQLAAAEAIVIEMAFLPLALDQAGAYIDEMHCGLSDYLELYRTHRQELLSRRGRLSIDHPEPVTTTWSLSFRQVEQTTAAAADLLRLCAFLEPDDIPEEVFREGSAQLGPVLQQVATDALGWNEALEALLRFSLIQRSSETKTFRLHRLVQAVLRDGMEANVQRRWAERAVRAVNTVFPETVAEVTSWPQYRRLLPQAQACSVLIQDYALVDLAAAALLSRAALYIQEQALYEQAESLYQQALRIRESVLGLAHPDVASLLNNMAILSRRQGKYEQAELLYQRALDIWEQALGPDHLDVARALNNLALLYYQQEKYEQAEPLCQRALRIGEQALGPDHPDVSRALNNLALLYADQKKYEQAESLFQRTLSIREQTLGLEHPEVAPVLNNLALLYADRKEYEQAEPLFQRAVRICEQTLGPDHPDTAHPLTGLANLYGAQRRDAEAELLYRKALSLRERALGPQHVETAETLHDLAAFREAQGKYQEAVSFYQRALVIREQGLRPWHPQTSQTRERLHALLGIQASDGEEVSRKELEKEEEESG